LAQVSGTQTVPTSYFRHPAAPSQVPSVMQLDAPLSMQMWRGSAAFAGVGLHVPIDEGRAQLRQAPAHASSQQRPSTQKVLTHSVPAVQGCPLGLGPQLPFWQTFGATQSMSPLHLAMHAPSVQR
jgi:hypothetical protein